MSSSLRVALAEKSAELDSRFGLNLSTAPVSHTTNVHVRVVPQPDGIRSAMDAVEVELFRDAAKQMLEKDPSGEAVALLVVAAHRLPTGYAGHREMCTWIRNYRATVLAKRRNPHPQPEPPSPTRRRSRHYQGEDD